MYHQVKQQRLTLDVKQHQSRSNSVRQRVIFQRIISTSNSDGILFISLAIVTISNMKLLINSNLDDYVSLFGYILLLYAVYTTRLDIQRSVQKQDKIAFFIITTLLCVGLVLQPMRAILKVRLLITMIVFSSIAILSGPLIHDKHSIRSASYGVFFGIVISFISSIALGQSVLGIVDEGFGEFGGMALNCGLSHKNYLAMMLFASVSCLILTLDKQGNNVVILSVITIEIILLYLSHCRAVWILFGIFVVIIIFSHKKYIEKHRRMLFIIFTPLFAVGIFYSIQWIFSGYLSRSMTYMARFNGLNNYFHYCNGDIFKLLFGDAASFFGTNESYYVNFRILTGSSGSVDMAVLNILIKVGCVGLLGYTCIFIRYAYFAWRAVTPKLRISINAILIPLILSMFSENCVSTISISYIALCSVAMAGVCYAIQLELRSANSLIDPSLSNGNKTMQRI